MAGPGAAVKIVHMPVQDVAHTMKAARLLYSAPSYVLRGPIYLIFIITFTALIYSFFAKKDKLVNCFLELKAEDTKIQSPKRGTVRQVFVNEGDQISPYTPLVEIQVQQSVGDESESVVLQRKLGEINDELRWTDKGGKEQEERINQWKKQLQKEKDQEAELEDRIRQERLEHDQFVAEANRTIIAVETTLKKRLADVEDCKRAVEAAKVDAENAKKRYEQVKKLVEQRNATVQELNPLEDAKNFQAKRVADAESSVRAAEREVDNAQLKIDDAKGAPKKLALEWEQKVYRHNLERQGIPERKSQLQFDIARAEDSLAHGKEQLLKSKAEIEEKLKNVSFGSQFGQTEKEGVLTITSLYGGIVTKVNIKKDQLIASGEVLLSYVKEDEGVYGFVRVPNADKARVKIGQPVNIKYFAYPYQKFGIQAGQFIWIARVPDPPDKAGQGGSYEGRVKLARQKIIRDKEEVDLDSAAGKVLALEYRGKRKTGEPVVESTGTTVNEIVKEELANAGWKTVWVAQNEDRLAFGLQGTAEIITGEEHLIEIIFSPVSRWFASSGD
ncbi:MAG: HlyD family efflux transporter periplasmic adaptor subunit [Planctomycetota bacterium]